MEMIARAISFLESQDRPVELAWIRSITGTGSVDEVTRALAGYQNEDGGFGHGLEVDIKAPDSQPFGARLAMQVLIDCGVPSSDPLVARLASWLETNQGKDGCWRFPAGVYEHQLAPWFQGWTFPSLNPALDLAGCATRLGIGTPLLFERVTRLLAEVGTVEEARDGDFYAVLPYAEYFAWVDHPQSGSYLDAIATGMVTRVESGGYEDAVHFFDHVDGPSSKVSQRLPADLISAQLDRLEAEQGEDGGWPTPYDPLWRAWFTARSVSMLKAYGRW